MITSYIITNNVIAKASNPSLKTILDCKVNKSVYIEVEDDLITIDNCPADLALRLFRDFDDIDPSLDLTAYMYYDCGSTLHMKDPIDILAVIRIVSEWINK